MSLACVGTRAYQPVGASAHMLAPLVVRLIRPYVVSTQPASISTRRFAPAQSPAGRSAGWRSFGPKGRVCSVRPAGPTIARRTMPVGANQPPSGTAVKSKAAARGWFARVTRDAQASPLRAMCRNKGVPAGCDLRPYARATGRPADTPLRGAHAARLDFDTALRAGSITGGRCSSRWRSFGPQARDCSIWPAGPGLLCSARRAYDRAQHNARRGESTAKRRRGVWERGFARLVRPGYARPPGPGRPQSRWVLGRTSRMRPRIVCLHHWPSG